jgi:predicted regulator of Ras-like GTPase activity (Roadblock/LC7/MglB family)
VVETPLYEFSSETAVAVEEPPTALDNYDSSADVVVELPLKKLWHKLNPAVVQGASRAPNGDASLMLPLSFLKEQLARGLVRMPFHEFRGFAPEGLFTTNVGKENLEVDLPIGDILPHLRPEHLARRPDQVRVEVPDEIGPIFGPDGAPANGLRIAESKSRSRPAAPAAAPAAPVAPAPVAFTPPPVEEKISAPALPPVTMAPKAPAPIIPRAPVAPTTPITPFAPKPQAAIPVAPVAPIAPPPPAPVFVAPEPAPLRDEPIAAPKLDPSLATLRPKVPAPVAPPPAPVASVAPAVPAPAAPASSNGAQNGTDVFTLALMDVAAFWSEKGRNDLTNLYKHSVDIPIRTVEGGLKAGKLVFQWREVRPWLRLAPGNTMPTLQDELQIEFPLSIVAPRFLEQRMHGKPKSRIEVGDDIPDVFEQKTPRPAAPTTPAAPVLGAMAVPMDLSATQALSSASGDTAFLTKTAGKTLLDYGEIFGQPEKKNWTLAEITQKTMTLRGVAGAVIGSTDGLLVAGSWPNGVKGDAVAAFLPQIFTRLLQFTKELKLGEPAHITMMIENVPLQVFRAGTSFFTVIGRAGENLPKAQLNAIATRLTTNFSGK